jgi:uncharacterized membrane protein
VTVSELIVATYADPHRAAAVMRSLRRRMREAGLEVDDAAYAVRAPDGSVRLHRSRIMTAVGAAQGALWGGLLGLLVLSPVPGMLMGAVTGAATSGSWRVGLDGRFLRRLAEQLAPDSSALFVLVRGADPQPALAAVRHYGGTVLQTTLSDAAEVALRAGPDAPPPGTGGSAAGGDGGGSRGEQVQAEGV